MSIFRSRIINSKNINKFYKFSLFLKNIFLLLDLNKNSLRKLARELNNYIFRFSFNLNKSHMCFIKFINFLTNFKNNLKICYIMNDTNLDKKSLYNH